MKDGWIGMRNDMEAPARVRSIYILDDDEAVRSALAFFLASAGFSARAFGVPEAFLAEADVLPPGCLLLDVRMPGMDGFQVLERLEKRRAVLPVVVMTGHGDIASAVRAMKLGACDFVEKPFEEDVMLEILRCVFVTLDDTLGELSRQDDVRARLDQLTAREREVLNGLIAGRANKLIAYDLNISVRTIEMHRAAMMDRLGVRSLADALRLGMEAGVGLPPAPARLVARSA